MSEIATAKITPIILVHAVTAGGLQDQYPMDAERCWSPWEMVTKNYDRITLYPYEKRAAKEPRYESVEPALIRPSEAFGIIYKDLVGELKHNLSYGTVPVQPVYPFVYDWRQDNFLTAQRLREFVDEVIERTTLMKHDAAKVGEVVCDSVDMIGHSMGGLVIAGAVVGAPQDGWAAKKVRRVATLGTPFRGANAAILKLATGGGTLYGRDAKERERTMARVTPTTYQLLPSFRNALVESDGSEADIFLPETMQPSVPDTIAEFVAATIADQVLARNKTECRRIAGEVLKGLLDTGWKYRLLTDKVDPSMLRPDGSWLAIVGAGEKTHIKTGITKDPYGKRWFDFERPDAFSDEGWDNVSAATGDETVPLSGATPPWPDPWRNTVVVMRKDFGWLGEIGDRVLCNQLGMHSTLPLLDLVQRWLINFFRPEWASTPSLGQHGKLWGRPLPGFLTDEAGGVATREECETEWRGMIPKMKLSEVP